jgi:hypothetical protein
MLSKEGETNLTCTLKNWLKKWGATSIPIVSAQRIIQMNPILKKETIAIFSRDFDMGEYDKPPPGNLPKTWGKLFAESQIRSALKNLSETASGP